MKAKEEKTEDPGLKTETWGTHRRRVALLVVEK